MICKKRIQSIRPINESMMVAASSFGRGATLKSIFDYLFT